MPVVHFPPYQEVVDGHFDGLDIKLIRKIFENAKCNIKFSDMPWKRSVEEVKRGRSDILALASKTPEREKFALFTDAYRPEKMLFLIKKSNEGKWPLQSLRDIIKYKVSISVVLGAWYGKEFESLKDDVEFNKYLEKSALSAGRFDLLMLNRVQAVLHERLYLLHEINKNNLNGKVVMHPYVVNNDPVYFMLSKKSVPEEDIKLLNEHLNLMLKSDFYKQLYKL